MMVCESEECAREDFGLAVDVMDEAIREIITESNHCSFDLGEALKAFLCACHQMTGMIFSPEEVARIAIEANEIIRQVVEAHEFEAEALSGISDVPVVETPPRILLSKADVDALAEAVAERLRA
jgi:hypothetical protein